MNKNKLIKEELIGSAPVGKALFTLAFPSIISSIVFMFYNIADTYFVGLLGDDAALAAIGVAFPFFNISTMLGVLFSTSSNALVGKLYGEGNIEKASKVASKTFFISILCAISVALFFLVFLDEALYFFGSTPSVFSYAREYSFWIVIMLVFSAPGYVLMGVLRSQGFTAIASFASLLSFLINVGLAYVFIFPMHMGIAGAGLATAIASFCLFVTYGLFYLIKKDIKIKIHLKYLLPDRETAKGILVTGIPSMLSSASVLIMTISCNRACALLPDPNTYLTAFAITVKIFMVPMNIAIGYRQALLTVLSFSLGNKDYKRYKSAIKAAFQYYACMVAAATVLFIFLGKPILQLFVSNSTIVDIGYAFLVLQTLFSLGFYYSFILMSAHQALADLKNGSFAAILRMGLFFPVFLFLSVLLFGAFGLYISPVAADIATVLVLLFLYRRLNKTIQNRSLIPK